MSHYQYEDPHADAKQHDMEQRQAAPSHWSQKHGGACPMCGSHDGWMRWDRKSLVYWLFVSRGHLPMSNLYQHPEDASGLYKPCSFCVTQPDEFEHLTPEQVREWLEAGDDDA